MRLDKSSYIVGVVTFNSMAVDVTANKGRERNQTEYNKKPGFMKGLAWVKEIASVHTKFGICRQTCDTCAATI